jgi:hypothetical protein
MTDPGQRLSSHTWSARPGLVATVWVLALGTLLYAVFTGDQIGRLVFIVATAGLVAFGVFGVVARPRLTADLSGVEIRRLSGRQRMPWGSVRIRVATTRRLGRQVSLLELDTENDDDPDGGLIVLGWLDLGTEPADVAAVLRRYELR